MTVHEVPSGTRAFDWTVPDEWTIRDAFIEDQDGRRVVDFAHCNLHVVGYSEPVDRCVYLDELQQHLHSIPDMPDAIPYVTSYYVRRWGFCLSQRQRDSLKPGRYRVRIDSTLAPGSLTYGEVILPGRSDREVLFSTYICHPSMGNDQLSGPVLLTALARYLAQRNHDLTYRLVFIPETIGSLVYLSRHIETMRARTIAGLVVACVGDDRAWSMTQSRRGDTLSDRLCRHLLKTHAGEVVEYTYLWPDRGSDERNWCMPNVDLPVASFHRSKYGRYPEYHTSLDDLSLISANGFAGSLAFLNDFILVLESLGPWRTTSIGEPQLGKRGLYPAQFGHMCGYGDELARLMNVLAYCDGERDLVALADHIGERAIDCLPLIERLLKEGLVERAG
jgi:aminopeptidase-like protein